MRMWTSSRRSATNDHPPSLFIKYEDKPGPQDYYPASIMPAMTFGAGDLLEYNSKYRLLICRECQYAIQKTALGSHLLRHKIYRGDRQRLLSSIAQLDLLEPHHVPLPAPGSPPVDALPVLSGYRCAAAGCQHLTASSKRMKRHWSGVHGLSGSVTPSSSFAHPVKLQTFFRGTKIRYFEVAWPTATLINSDDYGDEDDDDDGNDGEDADGNYGEDGHEGCEEQGLNAITPTPPPPPHMPALPGTTHDPFPGDFNLETLAYFHHFTTTSSLTLPGAEGPQSAEYYWQMHVVSQALRRRWLMCGLLAISAHHSAALADDTATKLVHRERGLQFSSEFSAGLEQTKGCGSGLEASEIAEEAKKTGEQISCLLHCAQWALAEPALGYGLMTPCQLLSIMSTIRGCVISDTTLRYSDIRNDGQGCHEELFLQGFLGTRTSSQAGNPPKNSAGDNMPSLLRNLLRALPFRIAQALGRSENPQDVFTTLSAIKTVVECCEISFASDDAGAAWQGVATWLANLPDHFYQMLLSQHPAALVVLAHWAAMLLKRAEHVGCWFLKGSAKIIVLQVARQLSTSSHEILGLVEYLVIIVKE